MKDLEKQVQDRVKLPDKTNKSSLSTKKNAIDCNQRCNLIAIDVEDKPETSNRSCNTLTLTSWTHPQLSRHNMSSRLYSINIFIGSSTLMA
jgi:hypothetical protein